jgi:hypothetical protein
VLLTAAMVLPGSVAQGQSFTYGFAGLVGAGGSLDESDAGLGNISWQLLFTSDIAEKTYVAVRVGGVHWDSNERVAEAVGPSLYFASVAGEYRETRASFSGGFVEPGVYLGLGYYWMDGEVWLDEQGLVTQGFSDHGLGVSIGLTGDIALNARRNWTLRIELAGHYADLDAAQLFGLAHIGISYHF